MRQKFIPANRDQQLLFPPSIQDWLPEEHLARFVVDIVSQLNLRPLAETYEGKGLKAYHPEILLSLLFYGYATGVFSSRKIEKATYDSVAFRFISANTHPDHDTIATFRKRFLGQLKPLFVQILLLAREMGLLKVGKISLDGTKIKANASKHHALSWEHAKSSNNCGPKSKSLSVSAKKPIPKRFLTGWISQKNFADVKTGCKP
jgi:transposase